MSKKLFWVIIAGCLAAAAVSAAMATANVPASHNISSEAAQEETKEEVTEEVVDGTDAEADGDESSLPEENNAAISGDAVSTDETDILGGGDIPGAADSAANERAGGGKETVDEAAGAATDEGYVVLETDGSGVTTGTTREVTAGTTTEIPAKDAAESGFETERIKVD